MASRHSSASVAMLVLVLIACPSPAAAQTPHRFGAWIEAGLGLGTDGGTLGAGAGLRVQRVVASWAGLRGKAPGVDRDWRYSEVKAGLVGWLFARPSATMGVEVGLAQARTWEENDCPGWCDNQWLGLGRELGPIVRVSGVASPNSWMSVGLAGVAWFADGEDFAVQAFLRVGAFP